MKYTVLLSLFILTISISCVSTSINNDNISVIYNINNHQLDCSELKVQITNKVRFYQFIKNNVVYIESKNELDNSIVQFFIPSSSKDIIEIDYDTLEILNFYDLISVNSTTNYDTILGYNCQKYTFGTNDILLGEIFYLEAATVQHSFLSDIFKGSNKIPLKIKVYGGVEYIARDINFGSSKLNINLEGKEKGTNKSGDIEMLIYDTYGLFRP